MATTYDTQTKIWSGVKEQPFYDTNCSIGKIIFINMKNDPNQITQISDIDGKAVSNKEALTWAIRIAQHFNKMGLGQDDIIGIAGKNSTYLMPLAVGCWLNATPFHAINTTLDDGITKHLFDLTKPEVIFCDGQIYEKILQSTKEFKPLIYTLVDHLENVPKIEDLLEPTQTEIFYRPKPLVMGRDQTMAIVCSSGTTGLPKGVCISNHYLLFENLIQTKEDVLYGSGGLDWVTGLYIMVLCCTKGATRIISTKPHTAEYFVELVKKYKITWALAPPRHVAALNACATATPENLASIRFMILGGGFISLASMERLQTLLVNAIISYGYQSSELGLIAANAGLANGTSVGMLSPGLRMRLVDDDGKNLGPNEVGEIYVHTERNWNGYYRNPIATENTQDSLGWFHTGDMGYFDDKNFLYIVDRKKEILKYDGMHYWPAEIEKVIFKLPDVVDVAVVGLYNEENGDAAGAVVVKAKGSSLSEQNVENHVENCFSAFYKHLHAGVVFVEKLPQNYNGKTDTKQAKALLKTASKIA